MKLIEIDGWIHMGSNEWKRLKPTGKFKYYINRLCDTCGKPYFTDKYSPSPYCSPKCGGSKKGRPIGTKLSEITKDMIALGRTGKKQTKQTKKKISDTLKESIEKGLCNNPATKKGPDNPQYKHGSTMKNSPLYRKLQAYKARCYNPNSGDYRWYGAKGIGVCDEWMNDFTVFKNWCLNNGWKKRLDSHRPNVNGDYGPDNLVFIPHKEHMIIHAKLRQKKPKK